MNPIADKARSDILNALENDQLVLPTLPEVALKVRDVANDEDAGIMDLGAVIGNDAALTARIIKVANNPMMRGNQEIKNLQMALSRMGMQYTATLATGLAMEQMFHAKSPLVEKRMRDVWQRSSEIAGMCQVLARFSAPHLKADQATLAGLVHQIGVLPILTFAEDHPELLNPLILDMLIQSLHAEIGVKILTSWDFDEDIVHIPEQYLQFGQDKEKSDLADVVTVAMLQSYMGSDHPMAKVNYHTVMAFERLGLDPDMQDTEAEDISAEMEAAMTMLA